jgi:hypothetical protein
MKIGQSVPVIDALAAAGSTAPDRPVALARSACPGAMATGRSAPATTYDPASCAGDHPGAETPAGGMVFVAPGP